MREHVVVRKITARNRHAPPGEIRRAAQRRRTFAHERRSLERQVGQGEIHGLGALLGEDEHGDGVEPTLLEVRLQLFLATGDQREFEARFLRHRAHVVGREPLRLSGGVDVGHRLQHRIVADPQRRALRRRRGEHPGT